MAYPASMPHTSWSMCSRHCFAGMFLFQWLERRIRVSLLEKKSLRRELTTTCFGRWWWFSWFSPFWRFAAGFDDCEAECSLCRRPGMSWIIDLMWWSWCTSSYNKRSTEERWVTTEPDSSMSRCETLQLSTSVPSRLPRKTLELGTRPLRTYRPTSEPVLKERRSSPRLPLTYGTCTMTVTRSICLDMRFEFSVPVPFAIVRTWGRSTSMQIQLGTFDGQGVRVVDAPQGMEFWSRKYSPCVSCTPYNMSITYICA